MGPSDAPAADARGERDAPGVRNERAPAALVFAGGDPPAARDIDVATEALFVVAADSGLEHAHRLGVHVDLVVGDFDSVDPAVLDAAIADGVTVERHPRAKDATDLELALDAARDRGISSVHLVGLGGGRLDHFLANALLLSSPRYADLQIEVRDNGARLVVVRDRVELSGSPGGLCSLLPLGGPAVGVITDGLRYPLRRETLSPGTTRGVSNEFLDTRAIVSLDTGVLLAILPAAFSSGPISTRTDA